MKKLKEIKPNTLLNQAKLINDSDVNFAVVAKTQPINLSSTSEMMQFIGCTVASEKKDETIINMDNQLANMPIANNLGRPNNNDLRNDENDEARVPLLR